MHYRTALVLFLSLFVAAPPAQAARSDIGYPRLMQGPMVGAVAPDSIALWVRASGDFDVWVEYGETPDFTGARTTDKQRAQKANDYCLTFRLTGLAPSTRYYYRVYVHDGLAHGTGNQPPAHSRTAPPADFDGRLRVMFGSCARYLEDPDQPIWDVVERMAPDLFLWLGDNIYGDSLDPDILAEEWRRQRDVPRLQPVLRTVPHLAIWDDHDFGLNDHDRTNPIKEDALAIFQRYWANPGAGTADTPGVFFNYRFGPIEFFMLDGRYHRDPVSAPTGPEKTMLGAGQLQWLLDGLSASDATFKVIASGVGWTKGQPVGGDAWSSYLHERAKIFEHIRDAGIEGVFFLSGDTHVAEMNCIPFSEHDGYDYYELVSSPLAQRPTQEAIALRPERRVRRTFVTAPNAGVLDFDFTADVPTVTLNTVTIYGSYAWPGVTLAADELVNGVQSYTEKQNRDAKMWDAFAQGGVMRVVREGYYP